MTAFNDPDQDAARPAVAEELLAHRVDGGPVPDVGEVNDHLQHVGEGGPGRRQDGPDVLQGGRAWTAATSSPPTRLPSPSRGRISDRQQPDPTAGD